MELNYMTQEEKDLLLKDLCGRLYYKVKISLIYNNEEYKGTLCAIYPEDDRVIIDNLNKSCHYYNQTCGGFLIGENKVKPYLFPISSMTEEQKKEYYSLADDVTIKPGQGCYLGIKIHCIKLGISDNPHEEVWDYINLDALNWLNKNHFDYRGLIEKGLAIDATNLNIY